MQISVSHFSRPRGPRHSNSTLHNAFLNKAFSVKRSLEVTENYDVDKHDNVIMGDIKTDTQSIHHPGYTKLILFCDVFGLSNLERDKTCFTKNHCSSIDVMLTNKPKIIKHRSYKKFDSKFFARCEEY